MYRDENYFFDELQKDEVLYKIFSFIGEYSSIYYEKPNFFKPKQVNLKDIINAIKSNIINKSDNIIQTYIDTLIKYGLCKYVIENDNNAFMTDNREDIDDANRLKFYNDLGYPKEDAQIILTSNIGGCSGISLYKKIFMDKKYKEDEKFINENLQSCINAITEPYDEKIKELIKKLDDITQPYDEKIQDLTNKLDKKMNEVNHAIDDGVIKNIQVISIFAGIISLLFANVMGIKDFSTIGVPGLFKINLFMVLSIFALIIFVKLLIIGDKLDKRTMIICLLIILFISVPIFFLK